MHVSPGGGGYQRPGGPPASAPVAPPGKIAYNEKTMLLSSDDEFQWDEEQVEVINCTSINIDDYYYSVMKNNDFEIINYGSINSYDYYYSVKMNN